jgi:hypothetical protein
VGNSLMSLVLQSSGGGQVTIQEPATASNYTVTLPAGTGTITVAGVSTNIVQGTSQASTSGTSVLFTGIPSWAKRVSVIFNGMSTSGTSLPLIQVGSGTLTTTGYNGAGQNLTTTPASSQTAANTGWPLQGSAATNAYYGLLFLVNITGNTWVVSGSFNQSTTATSFVNGSIALSGALDRVNITTTNGTDTFDAGAINIMYE